MKNYGYFGGCYPSRPFDSVSYARRPSNTCHNTCNSNSVQLTDKIFTPDEPLQRSWYLAGGLNQRTSGPSFSDVKPNDKRNCSPTSAIVSGLLSYCGLSNCNWTPTLEQGWWVGEAREGCGCVDGISTQSKPVSTDIDGAVETGCPY